jgi:hypothetical protein
VTVELLIYIAIVVPGMMIFGHFEERTPLWRRFLKHGLILAITYALYVSVGRPWSWLWLVFMGVLGITVHLWWTRKHNIHPLTAEPREKYYALRGWKMDASQEFSSQTK